MLHSDGPKASLSGKAPGSGTSAQLFRRNPHNPSVTAIAVPAPLTQGSLNRSTIQSLPCVRGKRRSAASGGCSEALSTQPLTLAECRCICSSPFFIIAISLLLNHSPCEWFSLYKKAGAAAPAFCNVFPYSSASFNLSHSMGITRSNSTPYQVFSLSVMRIHSRV